MRAIENRLVDIIEGNKQFVIPVFQRDYSWGEEQCERLWEDVLVVGSSSKDAVHFFGAIVYVDDDARASFGKWLVIDGQQRLTSVLLLLTALRDHLRNAYGSCEDVNPDHIDCLYLLNLRYSDSNRYRLTLRRHDDATLRALMDSKDPRDLPATSDNVVEAYRFFRDKLRGDDHALPNILGGLRRLTVVEVALDRDSDDPQKVFESLNSTGVDLAQSDLIRNYLLMAVRETEQTRLYDEYWSVIEKVFRDAGSRPDGFLRDYVALRRGIANQIRAEAVYEEFQEFREDSLDEPLEALLQDMLRAARRYAKFLQPNLIDEPRIREAMRHLRRLGTAHATLVMLLYGHFESDNMNEAEFVQAINLIESYLVRRAVLNSRTRNHWSIFARMAQEIESGAPLAWLSVSFARLYDRFPPNDAFSHALQYRDLYGRWLCRLILVRLENWNRGELAQTSGLTVEHVMPQDASRWGDTLGDDWENIHSTWLHRLGNLTLTAYNSRYSNLPFGEKKTIEDGFENSPLRLNFEYIAKQDRWSEHEIKQRGEQLACKALEIWPSNEADPKLLAQANLKDKTNRFSDKTIDDLEMPGWVNSMFMELHEQISHIEDCTSVVERHSVCYYDVESSFFFVESLPMTTRLRVLLPMVYDEADDPEGVAIDASRFRTIKHASHRECGVIIDVWDKDKILAVLAMVQQARELVLSE